MTIWDERYARAAERSPAKLAGLLRNRQVVPVWGGAEPDDFSYVRENSAGEAELVVVRPGAGSREVVGSAAAAEQPTAGPAGVLASPDGKLGVFRRDHDVWLRDLVTGDERALTGDGEPGWAWGELPENSNMYVPFRRMGLVLPPVATVFSPSGRRVLTMRYDQREMAARDVVENVPAGQGRPVSHRIRVQLDGEPKPPPAGCRIVDVETGRSVEVDVADGLGAGLMMNGPTEVAWDVDEATVWLTQLEMGGAELKIVAVDVASGARRTAVSVVEEPLYEANQFLYNLPLVKVLPENAEAVVFSQRDGWGHLYRYDLASGECTNRISDGELVVRDLLFVDAVGRHVTFLAQSGEHGQNPAWRGVYRAGFDGGSQELLTPEPADHDVLAPVPQFFHLVFGGGKPPVSAVSPTGRYFVDCQSTVETAPVIVLRDAEAGGAVVVELERTDVSRALAAGYVAPTAFHVTADDGATELWGVLRIPEDPVDPASIPVIDHIYAGFQTTMVPPCYLGGTGYRAADVMAGYAELGFAGFLVDGRGTPGRHRGFRQYTHRFGHTGRGLGDHVWVLGELAKRHPELDATRAGIIGHSYGGYNAARTMLMFPEAFAAGVAGAGVHQATKMPYGSWAWFTGPDPDRGSPEYTELGNLHLADRLKGRLLIACGEIDENATVDHSLALAQALLLAGKRFDLKIWPGLNHYEQPEYVLRAFWDHFVGYLHGAELPV